MNKIALRKKLIWLHLGFAAFLAPMFFTVAVTGAMDLAGIDAKTERTPITLPAGQMAERGSPSLESDIRTILQSSDIDHNFEYLRDRGSTIQTRPTSRKHINFKRSPDGLQAEWVKPNLQYSLMELHKGHGPKIFKLYQILAGISLFFIVLGGLLIGLLAPAYRNVTLGLCAVGALVFLVLGFVV